METLERKSTPCPHCGAVDGLVLTQHSFNREYKCRYCGIDYVVSGQKSDPFDAYRDLLIQNIDLDGSMVERTFDDIQKRYPGFVKYDPQFCLVKIACLTKNFRTKYKAASQELIADLEALYSTANDLLQSDKHYSLDAEGTYLHKRYLAWRNYKKKIIATTAAIAVGAAAVLAVPFFIVSGAERELKDESSGISVSIGKGNYGTFEKYSVSLDVERLVEGTTKHEQASILLKNEATKYKIYDLNIVKGTDKTQPSGKVEVTMPLPEDFSVKNTVVYYIADDGKCELLASEVNEIADTVTFTTDHFSLYAVAEHPFVVTFETGFEYEIPSQAMLWGSFIEEPEEMEREGYTFGGWYDGGDKWNFESDILSKDVVLSAKWTGNPYTITYEPNGGTCAETQNVVFGEDVMLETPTRNGYKFKGWYDEQGELSTDGTWNVAADTTLTAKWAFNVSEIGKYVENGATVTDVDTKKTYVVFNNMAKTPKLNSKNGMRTDGSVIIDWSKYADGEYDYLSLCTVDGNRYGGGDGVLDVDGIVKEVYFIGNSTATYLNVHVAARNYNRYDLKFYFENFNMKGSIKQTESLSLSTTFECEGSNSVKAYEGQVAIDGFDACAFIGGGSFSVYGGDGGDGGNGGDGMKATSVDVNNGSFKVVGGNGGNGFTDGQSGGNGGAGLRCTHLTLKKENQKEAYNFCGGNGGNGKDGLDGNVGSVASTSESSPKTSGRGTNGSNGGNGGSGAAGVFAESIDNSAVVKISSGNGGDGGNGGRGGNGGAGSPTDMYRCYASNGGGGGNGGDGGNGGFASPAIEGEDCITTGEELILSMGLDGNGGNGGDGGSGGAGGRGVTEETAWGACTGVTDSVPYRGKRGGDGGNGGNGGNAGYGRVNGKIGKGGNGGAGGAHGHLYVWYVFESNKMEHGTDGKTGANGKDGVVNLLP